MGKINGNFTLSGNINIDTNKPIDSRSVVEYKADLTKPATWSNFQYTGMVVSVVKDADTSNNGLYMYIGASNNTDVALESNWVRLDGQQPSWEFGQSE